MAVMSDVLAIVASLLVIGYTLYRLRRDRQRP